MPTNTDIPNLAYMSPQELMQHYRDRHNPSEYDSLISFGNDWVGGDAVLRLPDFGPQDRIDFDDGYMRLDNLQRLTADLYQDAAGNSRRYDWAYGVKGGYMLPIPPTTTNGPFWPDENTTNP